MTQAAYNTLCAAGYKEAQRITREYAKTYYLASLFLPVAKRRASCCVYAACRMSDECVDNTNSGLALSSIEEACAFLKSAYTQDPLTYPLACALRETIQAYDIPYHYFEELLKGMRQDLSQKRYATFAQLYEYCYRAAGVVGLLMLQITGYRSPAAKKYAVSLGLAMQLTNILRDIAEDYQRGRIYLPQEDLEKYGVTEEDIRKQNMHHGFQELMRCYVSRAREYYRDADKGICLLNGALSRISILTMKEVYAAILDTIEHHRYDIFSARRYVSKGKKAAILTRIITGGKYLCTST